LYESHNGRFGRPRENGSGGQSGSSAVEMVQLKIVTLCRTHKKSTTTLLCPTATVHLSSLGLDHRRAWFDRGAKVRRGS
jgi:hypothetical protein